MSSSSAQPSLSVILFVHFQWCLFIFSDDHLNVAGRAHVQVNAFMSSTSSKACLWLGMLLLTWIWSKTRELTFNLLSSALLSAPLSMQSRNSALFCGHQPCVQPYYLVWAHVLGFLLLFGSFGGGTIKFPNKPHGVLFLLMNVHP